MEGQNPYQTPNADLGMRRSRSSVTNTMAETLGSGAFWARLLSVVNFIVFAFIVISILGIVFVAFSAPDIGSSLAIIFGNLLSSVPSLVIYWFYGISMHRYAGAAKRLRNDTDEHDVAMCFASFSTYLKVTGILFIISLVFFVLGILLAIASPAMM